MRAILVVLAVLVSVALGCGDGGFMFPRADTPCGCDTCYTVPPGHRDEVGDSVSCQPWPPGQKKGGR